MPAIIPIVAGAAAWLGASALGLTATATVFGLSLGMSWAAVIGTVVTLGASMVMGALSKPKAARVTTSGQAQDRKQLIRSTVEPQQIVYGYAKIGGTLIYAASSGANLRYLHLVIVLAAHPCDDIPVVWVNGEAVRDSDCDGSGMITRSDHPQVGRVRIEKYPGGQTSGSAALTAESPDGWGADHVGYGLTYIYVRLEYDEQRMSALQEITAEVKGKNNIWDPRAGAGGYTSNWALCMLDYVRGDHGLGLATDEIDWPFWEAAANLSDEPVQVAADGTTQPRYLCDGSFKLDRTRGDILQSLETAGAGVLTFVNGLYRLHGGGYTAPTASLGPDDFAGTVELVPRSPRSELFNSCRGTFIDPASGYQAAEFGEVYDPAFDAQDGGARLPKDLEFQFTNNRIASERLARITLLRARYGLKIRAPLRVASLRMCIWQVVAITLPDLGYSNKPMRLMSWEFDPSTGLVSVELQEDSAFNYAWIYELASPVPSAPPTTLINSLLIPTPGAASLAVATTVQADGTVVPALAVTWTEVAHAFVIGTEVHWRAGAGDWQSILVPRGTTRCLLSPLVGGSSYEVRLRAVGGLAKSGFGPSATTTATADTTPPSAPISPTAAPKALGVDIGWVAPGDPDVSHYELQERTDVVGSSWAGLATTAATSYTRLGMAPGTTLRWRIRAVDRSGNAGPWSAEVAQTAGAVVDGDLAPNAVTTPTIVADAVTTFASTSGFTTVIGDGTSYLVLSMSFYVPDTREGTLFGNFQHGYSAEVAHAIDIYVDGSLYANRGSAAINDYPTFQEPLVFSAGSHWINIFWQGQPGVVLNRRNLTLMMRAR